MKNPMFFILTSFILILAQTAFPAFAQNDLNPGNTADTTKTPVSSNGSSPLDDLQFTYNNITETVWPIEWWIKQPVLVRNRGARALNLTFMATVAETGMEISAFPQPYNLYLSPGEEQTIWIPLDSSHIGLTSQDLDREADHTRTVLVQLMLKSDPSATKSITLHYKIQVLPRSWYQNHPNARIYGYVYDRATGRPLKDIKVELRGVSMDCGPFTNGSGYYEMSFYAHRNAADNRISPYVLSVTPEGYEAFIKPLLPVSGDSIRQDVHLERTRENVSATLQRRVETNMTIYRGAVTRDERYVVFSQGHPELDITDEEVRKRSSVLLFDTNGTLLWRYSPYGQIWGVDIAEDGSFVAASVIDTGYPSRDRAVLLDRNGNELWNTLNLGAYGSREIKISHNGRYVAWGTGDGDLFILDAANGNVVWRQFLEGQIRQIAFSSDDSRIFAGSGDGYLYILGAGDGRIIARANIEAWPYSTGGLALSRNGAYAATASKIGNITLVDAANGQRLWTFDTVGGANSVDISPNGDFVIAGSGGVLPCSLFDADGDLRWWKAAYDTKSVMIMNDGRHIAVGRDWGVDVINANGTVLWSHTESFSHISKPVETHFVYVFRNQTRMITGHGSGAVYFWKLSVADIYPPLVSSITPSNNSATNSTRPTISANYSDEPSGVSPSSVTLRIDGRDVTASANVTQTGVSYTASMNEGLHTVQLTVTDKAGNTATATWTFTISVPGSYAGYIPHFIGVAVVATVVAVVLVLRSKRQQKHGSSRVGGILRHPEHLPWNSCDTRSPIPSRMAVNRFFDVQAVSQHRSSAAILLSYLYSLQL